MKTVRFKDFWQDFEPTNNLFLKILKQDYGDVEVIFNHISPVDYEFQSVFMNRRLRLKSKVTKFLNGKIETHPALVNTSHFSKKSTSSDVGRRIWFTGENIRPPLASEFDGYLSFDQEDFGGRNAYMPLWFLRLDWFNQPEYSSQVGTHVRIQELSSRRRLISDKKKFACAFIGNAHPFRSYVLSEISKLGVVDVFGRSVGRPVSSKYEIARQYKYSICFENDLYPGYVTEKLVDAYVTETVPLYWGNLGNDNTINRSSFLNLADFNSIAEFVEFLSDVNYKEVYEQSFLKTTPSLQDINSLIFNLPA